MILAHKIRLDPTPEQVHYFRKAAGTARFTYNWGLAEWKRMYQAGEKPSDEMRPGRCFSESWDGVLPIFQRACTVSEI
jgi:transposase